MALCSPSQADFYDGLSAYERGDYSAAMEQWFPLAEGGIAVAQNNLGVMYDHGQGVAEDDVQAVRWYRLAAEQGNAQAQYSLGLMYGNGHGVPEDDRAAVKWYRLAAAQGSANAQYHLALVHDFGEGVAEDDAVAALWYRRAADLGDSRAQYNLALLYDFGKGLPEDDVQALKWYKRAAKQGDAKAQYMVGVSYFKGEGVAADPVVAYAWMTLAAYQRHVRALQTRGEVWAVLSADERSRGKALRKQLAQTLAIRKRLNMPADADADVYLPTKAFVEDIQATLLNLGYEPGPLDGILGAQTRDAVRAFQRGSGLAETGQLTRDLLKLMRLQ
jgi:uncharacterized protein